MPYDTVCISQHHPEPQGHLPAAPFHGNHSLFLQGALPGLPTALDIFPAQGFIAETPQNLWTDSACRSHPDCIAHHSPSAEVLQKKGGGRVKDGFKHCLIIFCGTVSTSAWLHIQVGRKQCNLIRNSKNTIKPGSPFSWESILIFAMWRVSEGRY